MQINEEFEGVFVVVTLSEKVSAVRVITSASVYVVRIGRRKRRTEMKTREAEPAFIAAEKIITIFREN